MLLEIAGTSKTKLLTALEGGDAEKMRTEFNKHIEIFNDGFERLCHSMGQDYCQRVFNSVYDVAKGIQESEGHVPVVSMFQIYAGEKKKLESLVNKPRLIDELAKMIEGLKSIDTGDLDYEVQAIRHSCFMDAYEKVYDVRLKYDSYFEQSINLSKDEDQKLLNKIHQIKLPNMKALKFKWSDTYPHNAAVREFLTHAVPDRLEKFEFRMNSSVNKELSEQFLEALVSSELHFVKKLYLSQVLINQNSFETLLSKFKKSEAIILNSCYFKIESGFKLKESLFKGFTCNSLNFSGCGTINDWTKEELMNLINVLASVPNIKHSIKYFNFHDCNVDPKVIYLYLAKVGFTDVKISLDLLY